MLWRISNRLTQRRPPVLAVNRPDQNDPAQGLHDFGWAPFRDTSDQFDSYSVYPSSSSLHSQESHSRPYPIDRAPDVGGRWGLEGPGTAAHLRSWGDSARPGSQVPVDQAQLPNDQTWMPASGGQSSYFPTGGPTFAWGVTSNPSEIRTPIHTPVTMSRESSLTPRFIENSVRQPRRVSEANVGPVGLVPAGGRLLQPLPSQRSAEHAQSPNTNPSEASSPTQSIASDPGGTKPASLSSGKRKKPRRKAHNAIERRYRSRLNDKISGLRDSIPSLRAKIESEAARRGRSLDPTASSGTPLKVNKAEVLEKATEYVKQLENENRKLKAELEQVRAMSKEGLQRGSSPSNYPLVESRRAPRPPLESEHRSESWHMQQSSLGTSNQEILQYGSSKPEAMRTSPVTRPPERRTSQRDTMYSTYRQP